MAERKIKRIGVLTGGGDCPGLNAAIRAIFRRGSQYGYDIFGIKNGWSGLLDGNIEKLDRKTTSGIIHKGGTIIGTSRINPLKNQENKEKLIHNIHKFKLDVIIAIGGEDTLGVAQKLYEMGVKIVGIPKTIDNDLSSTEYTFGFDTALTVVTEAIDRLHTTAESHNRIMVVEVMGRNAGWIATLGGIAGGADVVLIPEVPFDINDVCDRLMRRHKSGKTFSIVVVAEGAKPVHGTMVIQDRKVDEFGHVRLGGIGTVAAEEIEKKTGIETRVTVLGHIQRGGSPTPFDRILATRFGVAAVDLVKDAGFGMMVALQANKIISVPIKSAVEKLKTVDEEFYELAKVFSG